MNLLLQPALTLTYNELTALSGVDKFWNLFDTAFGTQYDRSVAQSLRLQWQAGDFSQLPQIEILDSSILGGANAAYASNTNKIYLSANYVATATPENLVSTLLEEIGHFVDAQINLTDSAGDEGAIFAALVLGESLSNDQLQHFRTENDWAVITLDGQMIEVEQQNFQGTQGNDYITGTDQDDLIEGLAGSDYLYGEDGNDTINGGGDDDYLIGGSGNDTINGDAGNDTIYGEDGDDTISGHAGNDYLIGQDGNDTINGGGDDDYLDGGSGDDILNGGDGNDTISSDAGNDTINGGSGTDRYYNADYSDRLVGLTMTYDSATGNGSIVVGTETDTFTSIENFDSFRGTNFDDIIVGSPTSDYSIYGGAGNDSISGNAGNDYLYGEDGNDTINGGGDDDYLDGGSGNDILNGGDGNDSLSGGSGDDILNGGDGNDSLSGDAGNDTINGGSGTDRYYNADYSDRLVGLTMTYDSATGNGSIVVGTETDTFTSIENFDSFRGTNFDDIIVGSPTSDYSIYGGAGNDSISGNAGNDYLYGEDGNDTINGGGDDDYLDGGSGNDILNGGDGNDSLSGGSGDDILNGGDGNDSLSGDAGNDTINGGSGTDRYYNADYSDRLVGLTMTYDSATGNGSIVVGTETDTFTSIENFDSFRGTNFDDIIVGSPTSDYSIYGGAGNDSISGNAGNDYLYGEDGNDTINGGGDDDYLDGGSGNDILNGGDGNDSLSGGSGDDILNGGDGNDSLSGDAGNDTINGGSGTDRYYNADYSDRLVGLTMTYDSATGNGSIVVGTETDTFTSIENFDSFRGTNFDDIIVGSPTSDYSIYGGAGNDSISGNAGNDYLYGEDGNDTINGGGDDDYLDGGSGNDILNGGDGNDSLSGGSGDDILNGGDGNDSLSGDAGNDTINGGSGTDRYYNADYSDRLVGLTMTYDSATGNGSIVVGTETDTFTSIENFDSFRGTNFDDIIVGSPTSDYSIYGGAGNDSISGNAGNDYLYGEDGNDTINGGGDDDYLDGGSGNDILNGGDGNDSLSGGSGDDILNGGDGNDSLSGDAGNDTINGGSGTDRYYNADYSDRLVGLTMTYDSATGNGSIVVGTETDTFTSIENFNYFRGTNFDDIIVGSPTSDYSIYGGAGNDSISGNAGNDYLYGEDGNDTINGGGDDDYLDGGSGNDTINGDAGNDTIYGEDGDDTISGNAGNDDLYGQDGNDTINGGGDDDYLDGGSGNDILNGGDGNDTIYGEDGDDTISGNAGNDDLYGQDGNDTINGGGDDDYLDGGSGNDILNGGGDSGEIDYISGGSGSDRFIIGDATWIGYDDGNAATNGNNDYAEIADFNEAEGDIIQLKAGVDYLLSVSGTDTQILIDKPGTEIDEIIAIIRNRTDLSLTASYFDYKSVPSTLAIAPSNAVQTEGNSGSKAFTFSVTRSDNTTGINTVNWAVTGTGANPANAADFGGTLPTGTVTFAANETSKIITVNVSGDTSIEADETFTVTLSNPSNAATITTATATGTIENDDVNKVILNINGSSNEYALSAASQNVTDEFTISADKTELGLSGNTWKKLDIGNYNITNNTILEFEFQSSKRGEIHGIGFDTDNDVINNPQNLFQLSGTQNWGLNNFKNYSTGSGWQSYSITVGDYFTGNFNYLTFANDHDVASPDSNGQFRNIQLYENQNNNLSVNINGSSNEYALSAASQDVTDEFTISADKTQLGLSGNTWKKLDIGNYNITNNTILEFEFQSSKRGEIHGIGFDTDNDVINNPQNLFQLSGTQNWGLNNFKNYSTGSGWQSYSITVGDYFTGNFNYLTFANDHDVASPDSNGQFRNIQLYENQNNNLSVNINGSSNEYALSAASQDVTDEYVISADKTQLGLSGNTWKKLDIGNYNITNNTILEFEFQSSKRGEIHGIGFDTDNDVVNNPQNLFQLSGTQNWGLNNFKNYSTGSGWQSYSITVGDYFTGNFNYLTFANDHDVASPDSNGQFRNIQLYENQNVSVNINGSSNEYALSAASQNVTNEFTISADKTELGLSGNTWKKLDIGSYNITNNTILEFEFQSSKRGEIHGIGFDTDNDVINNPQNLFQLSGTQNWGLNNFKNYSTGSGWQSYSITVGDYFTGNFNYLTFANDHDVASPDSNGQFRNIQLYENQNVSVNINGSSNEYALSAASQNVTDEFTISADKTQLGLSGNTWKKLDIGGYNITNNTILEFEFQSSKRGEIHGIGFDNDDNVINNPQNLFQLSGTQNWGLDDFKNYSTGSGWQSYGIKVGDYFTGNFNYLTFANDHDVLNPDSNGLFRNIQLLTE